MKPRGKLNLIMRKTKLFNNLNDRGLEGWWKFKQIYLGSFLYSEFNSFYSLVLHDDPFANKTLYLCG